jgi:hypothetical protein
VTWWESENSGFEVGVVTLITGLIAWQDDGADPAWERAGTGPGTLQAVSVVVVVGLVDCL